MAAQALEQGRYLGRPPYGYRLGDAGPHPNKAHAAWGHRARRLEPDPETAPVVMWMSAQQLADHSVARIVRALNEAGVPCPSAAARGPAPAMGLIAPQKRRYLAAGGGWNPPGPTASPPTGAATATPPPAVAARAG
jgi:hypothetical protein